MVKLGAYLSESESDLESTPSMAVTQKEHLGVGYRQQSFGSTIYVKNRINVFIFINCLC